MVIILWCKSSHYAVYFKLIQYFGYQSYLQNWKKSLKSLMGIATKLRKETFIFYYFCCYSIVYCWVIQVNAFNLEYWAKQLWLQLRPDDSKRLYHRKSSWELVIKQCISKCMFRSSYEDDMNMGRGCCRNTECSFISLSWNNYSLANYFKSFDGETKG